MKSITKRAVTAALVAVALVAAAPVRAESAKSAQPKAPAVVAPAPAAPPPVTVRVAPSCAKPTLDPRSKVCASIVTACWRWSCPDGSSEPAGCGAAPDCGDVYVRVAAQQGAEVERAKSKAKEAPARAPVAQAGAATP